MMFDLFNDCLDLFESVNNVFALSNLSFDNDDIMRTDIIEENDNYLMEIEMPGFDKKNIKITLDNGYLTVSGYDSKKEKRHEESSVSRTYYVGSGFVEEDFKVSLVDGILSIRLPKETRKIEKKTIAIQ